MRFDSGIDFRHEAEGLGQGGNDALVMREVVIGKLAAFAISQPLLQNLKLFPRGPTRYPWATNFDSSKPHIEHQRPVV